MAKTPYEKLLDKRGNAVRVLQFYEKPVQELDAKSSKAISYATVTLPLIENNFKKYETISEKIEDHDDFKIEDLDPKEETILTIYINMASKLKEIIDETHNLSNLNSTATSNQNQNMHDLKLPPLEIPKFSGRFEEWTTFFDTFSTYVDSSSIANVSKMHYLKNSLTGTALRMIKSLPATDANYKVAWNLLCDRFHNKRAIINACLRIIMDQDSITNPNEHKIRELIDTTTQALQCIETLSVNTDDWSLILVYVIQTKLDKSTLKDWETELKGTHEPPTFERIMEFLETQYRIHDSTSIPSTSYNSKVIASIKTSEKAKWQDKKQQDQCKLCEGPHWLFFCPTFDNWSVVERLKYVNENELCSKCLHAHKNDECRSKYKCKICRGNHNTKLHVQNTNINALKSLSTSSNSKLLATAIVKVKDKSGVYHLLRAFIDQGSEGAVITEKAAQLLNLPRKREHIALTGVDEVSLGMVTSSVRIQVKSVVDDSFSMIVDAYLKRSILSSRLHTTRQNKWQHVQEIPLADPQFLEANRIDLLFGVDIYGLIIENGIRKGKPHEPVAQNSALGWLVFGAMSSEENFNLRINSISIDESLRRFWENEEVKLKPILSEEHQKCVEFCSKTTIKLPNGRIQVSMPFNMDSNKENFLGDSRKMALKRFFQLEKKFERNHEFHERYNEDIQNYIQNEQMSISKSALNEGYYLPHHAVVRENSTTTKQRTVFDASAKTTNGFSLNDRCLNGPTIQPELFDTFTRWRTHKIALTADAEKMYRQFLVPPEDRKYLKILYRFSKNEPIKTYELNTVTFGVKCAPYMAIQATFFLADLEKSTFADAAKRVKTDFYVDDCLSGSHTVESAEELQRQLNGLFKTAHISLRKWASNDLTALNGVPPENRAISPSVELRLDESIKTLGMKWTPITDKLHFTIDMSKLSHKNRITKRQLLSDASKLYDPCGLLSPITIKSKIMMQQIWKEKVDWDDYVSEQTQTEWNVYKNDLPSIESIKLDRWLKVTPNAIVSLHGFCDSSEQAMAALVYVVQKCDNFASSMLICAKTRVAPLSPVTIPRLELNGAVLLANLMNRVAENLNVSKANIHLWTDSSIVLCWLRKHPSTLKTFVSHRVKEIQSLYGENHWRHVRTHENPADIASRGALPSELKDNILWFNGPSWLKLPEKNWPKLLPIAPANIDWEEKPNVHINALTVIQSESEIMLRYDDLIKLLRITSIILRFVYRCKRKETLKYSKLVITADEKDRAKLFWLKYVQSCHFKTELRCLGENRAINDKSSIRDLNPQLNEKGIMILHGRLQYADFSALRKFPVILPAKSHFSNLVIADAHIRSLHGSIHLTLATLRQQYWVLNARNKVKTHIHQCMICYRQKPTPLTQLMAPLPHIKTTPSRAFLHCGMDFAGPFDIKISSRRNATTTKGYFCVFVCMVSKAVHLELVSDLSTQRFIMAFRRFISRRGFCTDVYCDQGSNFKGASNELPLLFLQAENEASIHIQNIFADDRIRFHFNPPNAPHWGGQWESFVKLTKHHLNRMAVSISLTFEDMATALSQIEACINSRPLCALTSDINDLDPLTAGHLLIGSALNLIPEPSLLPLSDNTLDRFQAIQKSVQMFWKRFYVEYLHTMHPRKKWYRPGIELKVNDLVVIIDDNSPPAKWLMGRVIEMHPGEDGYVRMVTLQTKQRDDDYGKRNDGDQNRPKKKPPTLQRPIAKLCKLPLAVSPSLEEAGGCSES